MDDEGDNKISKLKFKALVAAQVAAHIEGTMEVDEQGNVLGITMMPPTEKPIKIQDHVFYQGPELATTEFAVELNKASLVAALQNAMHKIEKSMDKGTRMDKRLIGLDAPKNPDELN